MSLQPLPPSPLSACSTIKTAIQLNIVQKQLMTQLQADL
jgi:hypothetical protein